MSVSHEQDKVLRQMLKRWKLDPPPPGLADNIARRATAHRQDYPVGRRLLAVMERAFTDWRYGLRYKAAAVAACALAGIIMGQLPATPAEVDLVALALAEDIWVGAL